MATIIGLVNVGALASTRPMLNLANLPNDIDALKALLLAQLRISVNVPTHSGLSRPLAHEMVLRG